MADIKFGLTEFAAYMAAGSGSRRTKLTNKKFPKNEDIIPSIYYAPVVNQIREYHDAGHPPAWLESEAKAHAAKAKKYAVRATGADRAKWKYKADQLRSFARVLRSYRANFGKKKLQLLPQLDIPFTVGKVRISIRPELHVVQGQTEKLIKLWMKDGARPKSVEKQVITQVMLEAANSHGHSLTGSQIMLFDIETGEVHKGAKIGAKLGKDITAECQAMEALWPTLERP